MTTRRVTTAGLSRVALVLAITAASMTLFGGGTARADDGGNFIVCADYNSLAAVTVGDGCTSLSDAMTAATAFSNQYASPVTIVLMPGDYCPFTLPNVSRGLTVVGSGAAGLSQANASYTVPEAELTAVTWDSSNCGTAPSYGVTTPDHGSQILGAVTLENFAVLGSADGPGSGLAVINANLFMRDVEVSGFSAGTGLTYDTNGAFASDLQESMDIEASAIVRNATGINVVSEGSIEDSTIADNTGTGLSVSGQMSLNNDTISGNATGIATGFGNAVQANNTIVGGNTTDCSGNDWEEYFGQGGAASVSGSNVTGSCTPAGPQTTDITYVGPMGDLGNNGGPTPTMEPPAEARAAAADLCNVAHSDQREDVQLTETACDVGALNTQASTTAALESGVSTLAFGDVPDNQTGQLNTTVDNGPGSGLVGVTGATTTGTDVSLASDGCQYHVLSHAQGSYCSVGAAVAPSGTGAISGSLTVHTTAGDLDIPVTANGVAPLAAPTNVVAGAENGRASLSFAQVSNPSVPLTGYDVQQSDDNGATWEQSSVNTDNNGNPTSASGLTNGTSYLFEIAARDTWGDGPWSAPSAPVTPHAAVDTSALSAPKSVTISAGRSTTLSTTLTDSSKHSPISGAAVVLTTGSATTGITATTGATGVATVTVHPTANTVYTWRYAGTSTHHAATSSSATVTVAQAVTATLSAKRVKHGKKVEIYGTVSPNEKGKTVVVQELVHGTWKSLAHPAVIKSQKLPGSHAKTLGFVYAYKPATKGQQTLRVRRAATARNAAGLSRDLSLTVT